MLTGHAGLSPFERPLTLFTRVRAGLGRDEANSMTRMGLALALGR
jgi:hypothetical protein